MEFFRNRGITAQDVPRLDIPTLHLDTATNTNDNNNNHNNNPDLYNNEGGDEEDDFELDDSNPLSK